MSIRLVIFDMDGTLANTEPIHAAVRERIVSDCTGGKPLTIDLKPVGRSMTQMYQDLLNHCHLDTPVEQITTRHLHETLQGVLDSGIGAEEGVARVIDYCDAHGISCAVASSSARYLVEGVLKHIGLIDRFCDIVCGDDGIPLKPDPAPYLTVLSHLNVAKDEAVAVEDSTNGVKSANAAGLRCFGYVNPGSGKQDLSAAYRVIDRMDLLIDELVYETHREIN